MTFMGYHTLLAVIVNGLVQGTGTCTFETNWEIAQFRVSPAPDQSPASEVRLP